MLSLFQKETYLRFKNVTSEGGTTGYIFFPAGYIIFLGWLRLFRSKRSGCLILKSLDSNLCINEYKNVKNKKKNVRRLQVGSTVGLLFKWSVEGIHSPKVWIKEHRANHRLDKKVSDRLETVIFAPGSKIQV